MKNSESVPPPKDLIKTLPKFQITETRNFLFECQNISSDCISKGIDGSICRTLKSLPAKPE